MIDKSINQHSGKKLYVCFVDFKSAFDTVWRQALLYKLLTRDVGGSVLGLLTSMYQKVKYCIKTKHGLTESFLSNIGVKQGCVLSPILFNLFLSDLPDIFDATCDPVSLHDLNLNCLLYADDLVLLSESANGLQQSLNRLNDYCNTWRLTINTSKTKVLIFNKGGRRILKNIFNCGDNILEITQKYCYLGIEFCASGVFTYAINKLRNQANKAMFKLRQFPINNKIKLAAKLFRSLIYPVISYGSKVWSIYFLKGLNVKNFAQICDRALPEDIHNKFCKYLLGVHRKATNAAVKAELGSFPILIDMLCGTVKYWLHLQNSDPASLRFKCLLEKK